MDDRAIIGLFWDRSPEAIPAVSRKYGRYLSSIAANILSDRRDAEECVSDTYLKAWNAMPPRRPDLLSAFLGRITRNLSLNRLKANTARKRGAGQVMLVLDELAECVSGTDSTQQAIDRSELLRAINEFLSSLPPEKRALFVRRYWYFDSVRDLARRFGKTENSISVALSRMRASLRAYLTERGFDL